MKIITASIKLVWILLPLAIVSNFFTGCQKCEDCTETITTVMKRPNLPDSVEKVIRRKGELCDEELENVKGKEKFSTSTSGNIKYETTVVTTCD